MPQNASSLRSIIDYGYHRQAAFYLDGSGKCVVYNHCRRVSPTHGVAVYDLFDEFIEFGRRAYKFAPVRPSFSEAVRQRV